METKRKKNALKKRGGKQKVVAYAAATGAVLGLGYLAFNYFQNKAASGRAVGPVTPAASSASSGALPLVVLQNKQQFPLHNGAKGSLVILLQKALLAIGGSARALIEKTSMRGNVPDGVFGAGTAKALLAAGYSAVVSLSDFERLLSMTRAGESSSTVFTSSNQSLAAAIIKAANARHLFAVLGSLQKISDPSQYSAVSSYFRNVRVLGTRVSSLVNALLSVAFVNNALAKVKIKAEFRRIGLLENSTGVWRLPSLGSIDTPSAFKTYVKAQHLYALAITDKPTLLKTADGTFITPPLNPNTLVGYVTNQHNGITRIIAPSGSVVFAPSNNLKLL